MVEQVSTKRDGQENEQIREALPEKEASQREVRVARVRALTAEIRRNLRHPLPTSDHRWLYDEDGLPRE